MSKVHSAIARNDVRELHSLAESGELIGERDSYGRTGLMEAVITGKNDIVKLFLDRGADTNAQDHNGYSALHFVAQDFQLEAARLLLNANAKVDIQDEYGNSPLWRAVFNSQGRGEVI